MPSAVFVDVLPSAYLVSATLDTNTRSAFPGSVITYTLLVSNQGVFPDTVTITPTSTWPFQVINNGPIEAGQVRPIVIEFSVPVGAINGATDNASVTLVSTGDPRSQSSVSLVSTVQVGTVYVPLIGR